MSATDASQQANRAGMDRQRLVVISYLVFGIILTLFLGHLVELAMGAVGVKNAQVVEGLSELKLANLIGFALTVGLAIYAWTSPKVKALSNEVAEELMRVTWPSWDETRTSTVAVVVASLVAAFILFGMDSLSYKLMVDWLPRIWNAVGT
ncbi:MAG: preprotein translocase subunit SecE [Myxococcales bacterium]|nr:preprotein translocase subunit SecE [Myxococcales bacterium]